jgi:4'-phosphopantetheinyl transferase
MTVGSEMGAKSVAGAGAIEVVLARLDLRPPAVEALSRRLCEAEQRRAARFRFARDRRRFIVARALLRELLARRLGAAPEAVQLAYGARGKPRLAPPLAASGWCFNLAHCAELALYAFARNREVGIDLEEVRAFAEADAVAARFFSRCENAAYCALDPHARPLGFFNCWTRKEAVVKALGDGLHMPLDSFDVSLRPGEPAAILRMDSTAGARCGWRLESFAPAPGFVAALAHQPR